MIVLDDDDGPKVLMQTIQGKGQMTPAAAKVHLLGMKAKGGAWYWPRFHVRTSEHGPLVCKCCDAELSASNASARAMPQREQCLPEMFKRRRDKHCPDAAVAFDPASFTKDEASGNWQAAIMTMDSDEVSRVEKYCSWSRCQSSSTACTRCAAGGLRRSTARAPRSSSRPAAPAAGCGGRSTLSTRRAWAWSRAARSCTCASKFVDEDDNEIAEIHLDTVE
jgi:hypothetical protein